MMAKLLIEVVPAVAVAVAIVAAATAATAAPAPAPVELAPAPAPAVTAITAVTAVTAVTAAALPTLALPALTLAGVMLSVVHPRRCRSVSDQRCPRFGPLTHATMAGTVARMVICVRIKNPLPLSLALPLSLSLSSRGFNSNDGWAMRARFRNRECVDIVDFGSVNQFTPAPP